MLMLLLISLCSLSHPAFAEQLRSPENWTTCEQFLNNTVFDPASVLDVEWRIFYFWNPEFEESYTIKFSRPSKVLVDRFRVELDKEINPPVNWTAAEFFMESSIDFSALFLRTNTSGLYRIIPSAAFDYHHVPLLTFGLKVVKPGYLGIANCKHRLCYALAPAEKMPYHYELDKAATSLGFYSDYNRSHVFSEHVPATGEPAFTFHGDEDDAQDEDLEVEEDPSRLDFF